MRGDLFVTCFVNAINLKDHAKNRRFSYALGVTYAPGKTKRPKRKGLSERSARQSQSPTLLVPRPFDLLTVDQPLAKLAGVFDDTLDRWGEVQPVQRISMRVPERMAVPLVGPAPLSRLRSHLEIP